MRFRLKVTIGSGEWVPTRAGYRKCGPLYSLKIQTPLACFYPPPLASFFKILIVQTPQGNPFRCLRGP